MAESVGGYTIRKIRGNDLDNYGLYFRGELLEVFASRKTAEKYRQIAENEQLERSRRYLQGKA